MADIRPFIGSRYAARLAGELPSLLSPPYDVISPEMQEALCARHENNLVRVDLDKALPGDDESSNRYSRAAEAWEAWKSEGVIAPDPRPALYVYEQEFDLPGRGRVRRRGFFCAVKIEDFATGGIKAHERTFEGPKADRLNLTRATNCNVSPIFSIYDDPDRIVDAILTAATGDRPTAEATIDGIVHRMWMVDDEDALAKAVAAMGDKELYIADGHHRYETSLNYRAEMRAKAEGGSDDDGAEAPYDRTLMLLANMHDPGMVILPTHRVLERADRTDEELGAVLDKLGEAFDIEELEVEGNDADVAASLLDRLEKAGSERLSFIWVAPGGGARLLQLKADAAPEQLIDDPDVIDEVKRLDVSILHLYMIRKLWLRPGEAEPGHDDIQYVKDAGEAVRLMREGRGGAAILLNATRMEQVCEVAGLGVRMPQKSTYFYPKIITGMVIRDMNAQG